MVADGPEVDRPSAQSQRDCAVATELLITAVDRLFRTSGTSGQSTDGPLQRHWRDAHCAAGHIVLQFPQNAAAFSASVFGPAASGTAR